jgi:hypothetical protein
VHARVVGDREDHAAGDVVSAAFTKGSAATFRPTCFIAISARRPTIDTPSAASNAVFSFAHQAACGFWFFFLYWRRYSTISVEGVPG